MSTLKKRQHYVWRHYLKSWSDDKDLIPSLIINEKKIATPNLMGVAQQRYHYQLIDFTIEEEIILKELVEIMSNDDTIKTNNQYFDIFTSYSKLKRILTQENISKDTSTEVDQKLDLLKINLMEEFHTKFENFGKKIIEIKNLEDLKFLEEDEALIKTLLFLSLQYVRTKNMQIKFIKKFSTHQIILTKYYNILTFVIANGIANGLRYYKEVKFTLLENASTVDFITSDQPITNLLEDDKNEDGSVKSLEFYYPLNPRLALKVHYKIKAVKFEHYPISEEEVIKLNNIMFEKSEGFIFAKNIKQLNQYKNCL